MIRNPRNRRVLVTTPHSALFSSAVLLGTLLGLGLALTSPFTLAGSARAETEEELMAKKTEWQERYRRLLQDEARLQMNATNARENYARAQRRNYPRGNALAQYLVQADDAEKELAKVKAELAEIFTKARNEGIPPGWLYAVEEEPISIPPPSPAASGTASDQDDPDDGRNPLYREDDATN